MRIEKSYVHGVEGDQVYDMYFPRKLGDLINSLSFDLYCLKNNYRFGPDNTDNDQLIFSLNEYDSNRCLALLKDFFTVPDNIKVQALHWKKEIDQQWGAQYTDFPYFRDKHVIQYAQVIRLPKEGTFNRHDTQVYYQIDHPYHEGSFTHDKNINQDKKVVLFHMYKDHYDEHKIIDQKTYDKLVHHFDGQGWEVQFSENHQHTNLTELHNQASHSPIRFGEPTDGLDFTSYERFVNVDVEDNESLTNVINESLKTKLKSVNMVVSSISGMAHLARLFKIPTLVWFDKETQPDYEKNVNWNGDRYQHIDIRSINTTDYLQAKIDHVLNG